MYDSAFFLRHLVFFMVGIVQDLFITYYYQSIAKDRPWRATILSSSVTLINLLILYKILTGIEDQVLSIILVYALGNGMGTMIVMQKSRLRSLLERVRSEKE